MTKWSSGSSRWQISFEVRGVLLMRMRVRVMKLRLYKRL